MVNLGTLNIRFRAIIGTQKGTTILTTTHMAAHGVVVLMNFRDVNTANREIMIMICCTSVLVMFNP